MPRISEIRESDRIEGKLPTYTGLGGYPLFYLTEADVILCATCANKTDREDPATNFDTHWEGSPIFCEDCNAQIDSAYGDPEESFADEPSDDHPEEVEDWPGNNDDGMNFAEDDGVPFYTEDDDFGD